MRVSGGRKKKRKTRTCQLGVVVFELVVTREGGDSLQISEETEVRLVRKWIRIAREREPLVRIKQSRWRPISGAHRQMYLGNKQDMEQCVLV